VADKLEPELELVADRLEPGPELERLVSAVEQEQPV
jgi:hypothetical protein